MTRRGLFVRVFLVVLIYGGAIGFGCMIRFSFPKREDLHYVLYKDLIPLIVAIPAAWLAFCFQRRTSYLRQLRSAWADAVAGVQAAIRYANQPRRSTEDRGAVLERLGTAIEGIRGLSRRADSLPLARLEAIRDEVEALGLLGESSPIESEAAGSTIRGHWEVASEHLRFEFDRVRLSPRPRAPHAGASPAKGPHRRIEPAPVSANSG